MTAEQVWSPVKDLTANVSNSNSFGKAPSKDLGSSALMANISFGSLPSFQCGSVMAHNTRFEGCRFKKDNWQSIPNFILLHILDFRRVGHTEQHIANVWKLNSVPSQDYIHTRLNLCSSCTASGHLADSCPDKHCTTCEHSPCVCGSLNPITSNKLEGISTSPLPGPSCYICGATTHFTFGCPGALYCTYCTFMGHTPNCCDDHKAARFYWRPKLELAHQDVISAGSHDKSDISRQVSTEGLASNRIFQIFPSAKDHKITLETNVNPHNYRQTALIRNSTLGKNNSHANHNQPQNHSSDLPPPFTAPTKLDWNSQRSSGTLRCHNCGRDGHVASSCFINTGKKGWRWVPKSLPRAAAPHSTSTFTPSSASLQSTTTTMANFPINVIPYLPPGMTVELGPPDRRVRDDMVVGPIPPLRHDFLAIAEANRDIPFHRKAALRHIIEGLLHESEFFPTEVGDHPLGVGIFGFPNTLIRDAVVGTTFELDEEEFDEPVVISFVPHDAALNMRLTSFGPEIWLLYIGFPYDYQTQHYMHKSVDKFGQLVEWHNPRGDRRFVLLKVRVIHLKFVPKSMVLRQLGGARQSWTVAVTMLRSSDWNAHIPDVPPATEDPPPEDGIPHPLHGENLTAEQIYQMQLHNWIAQNVAANANAQPGNDNAEQVVDDEVQFQPNWGVWPPSPPHTPPAMFNFQAWLAGEGLQVHHGIQPLNNLQDSPAAAWNDSISVFSSSDSSATLSDGFAIVPLNIFNQLLSVNGSALGVLSVDTAQSSDSVQGPIAAPPEVNSIELTLTISNAGMQFSMLSDHDSYASLLLNECVPMLRLNTYLTAAIRPIIAAFGPWSSGFGFRDSSVQFSVNVEETNGHFSVRSASKTVKHSADSASRTILIPGHTSWALHQGDDAPVSLEESAILPRAATSKVVITEIDAGLDQDVPSDVTIPTNTNALSLTAPDDAVLPQLPNAITEASTEATKTLIAPHAVDLGAGTSVVRKGKAKAPASVLEVRRSNRSNKYDGFKVPSVSDTNPKPSKVKPRVVPSATDTPMEVVDHTVNQGDYIPPPTPIQVLQHIGISKCAIPPAEVSEEALMADSADGPPQA